MASHQFLPTRRPLGDRVHERVAGWANWLWDRPVFVRAVDRMVRTAERHRWQ